MPSPRSILLAALVAAGLATVPAVAQRPSAAYPAPPADSALARARGLVANGRAEEGRRLVDSLLAGATARTDWYAEVLFWHGALATTAADAERDYRMLAVEYPTSPRAADALIALAQLEYARGDRARAAAQLERAMAEHPAERFGARAHYWMARVLLEGNDLPRGCQALDASRRLAAADDVELRNQMDYLVPRCTGVARATDAGRVASAAPAPAAAPPVTTPPATTAPVARAPAVATPPMSATRPATPPAASPAAPTVLPAVTPRPDTVRPAAPAPVRPAAPAPVRPAAPRPDTVRRAPAAPAAAAFAVQVAAFDQRAPAERLARQLAGRGRADARVEGEVAPFRVRFGRYRTRAEAVAAAEAFRRADATARAFVVTAEPPAGAR